MPFAWRKGLLSAVLIGVLMGILSGCTNTNSVLSGANPLGTDTSTTASATTTTTRNLAPLVNLSVNNSAIGFGGEVLLTAEAIDPDGDPLTFSWNASEGSMVTQLQNRATWKAPSRMGAMAISCSADDRKGGRTTATASISVVGGRRYLLDLSLNRASVFSSTAGEGLTSEWMPLANARVLIPAIGQTGISDNQGHVEFDLDATPLPIATDTEVRISYLNWELRYKLLFQTGKTNQVDSIQFTPGYEGVTVALGRGDSFLSRRGGIEVAAVEELNGQIKSIREVGVSLGTTQQLAIEGVAFLSAPVSSSDAALSLSKTGYSTISSLRVPVILDGVTLVYAQMLPANGIARGDPFVSWTKPFNGQKAVSVIGPFEVGFGQPMEQSTILDELEVNAQEMGGGPTVVLTGQQLKQIFNLEWVSPTLLRFAPKIPLRPLKRYSMLVTKWNARAADGRMLRNYTGMFGTFTTDIDNQPTVTGTSPRSGDVNFSRSGPFVVTFDRPMDPTSLTADLQLRITHLGSGASLAVDGSSFSTFFNPSWSQDDTVLAIVPKVMLAANSQYLIRAERFSLKSRTGKVMTDTSALWGQFTTGDL